MAGRGRTLSHSQIETILHLISNMDNKIGELMGVGEIVDAEVVSQEEDGLVHEVGGMDSSSQEKE